jgi:hypothetical protein
VSAVYDLLGYRIAVAVSDPVVGRACRFVLANFAIDAPGSETVAQSYSMTHADGRWHVAAGGRRVHSVADPQTAIAALEGQLVIDALKHRSDLFHVHGAALAPPALDGAVVLAGEAGVGKTTLARALLARGFLPFGDDVTMIDPASLELQPFPRAFHVREGADASDGLDRPIEYFHPPQWVRSPLPVKLILFLSRTGEDEARAVTLGPAEAASSLLRHSGTLVAAPAHALAVAVRLIAQARCYRFEVSAPETSARVVEALCTEWRSRPLEAIV